MVVMPGEDEGLRRGKEENKAKETRDVIDGIDRNIIFHFDLSHEKWPTNGKAVFQVEGIIIKDCVILTNPNGLNDSIKGYNPN